MAIAITRCLLSAPLSKPLSISTTRKLTTPSLDIQLSGRTTTAASVFTQKSSRLWRISVATGDGVPPPEGTLEKVQEIVPSAASSDEIVPTIISGLLFLAFIALSVLTIGVVYLAVQDFLQKREREKFEKEEAEKKKMEGKKKKKKRERSGYMIGPKGPIKLKRNPYDDD